MSAVNKNRLEEFRVLVQSGNGYLYFYTQDEFDLLTQTHELRFRLTQALDTFKKMNTSYTDIDLVEDVGVFNFEKKRLLFTGLSGTNENPNGTANNTYIVTEGKVDLTD